MFRARHGLPISIPQKYGACEKPSTVMGAKSQKHILSQCDYCTLLFLPGVSQIIATDTTAREYRGTGRAKRERQRSCLFSHHWYVTRQWRIKIFGSLCFGLRPSRMSRDKLALPVTPTSWPSPQAPTVSVTIMGFAKVKDKWSIYFVFSLDMVRE